MKTFKSVNDFIKKQEKSITWGDEMLIGGKIYRIFEYGGGSMMNMDYDYVYFVNKRTRNAIHIEYDCPSFQGGKQVNEYHFISGEFIPSMELWRTDTL